MTSPALNHAMKIRIVLPRPGRCGWTHDTKLKPLPAGLPDRTPVFIVAVNHTLVRARDASGREWPLARVQVDAGVYCSTPAGGWVHESTATARSVLRHELRHHLITSRPDGTGGVRWDEKASRLRWILQRNGGGEGEEAGACTDGMRAAKR
jgi:hypothetical protein